MATERVCSIEGCGKKHAARGWCAAHYARNKKTGDPLKGAHLKASRHHRDRPGLRWCGQCGKEHPSNTEFFHANATGKLGRWCIECTRTRDRLRKLWADRTPAQKAHHLAVGGAYRKTLRGRAGMLRKRYAVIDACDLSTNEVAAMIMLPCLYCGTDEENRGLDRVDNYLPHVRGNVVPCCTACNIARGARFTSEEMKIIGKAIAQVRASRPASHIRGQESKRGYRYRLPPNAMT